MAILHDFFDNHDYILGYTCDVTDGRELSRKILFNRWFKEANDGSLKKLDFQAENVYVSLIVYKDYFAIDQAASDIEQLIHDVLAQK